MKKYIRKIAGVLSAIMLVTSICPLIVVDEVRAETSSTRIEGIFHYNDEGTKDTEGTFIYDDAYFNNSAKEYNPSLASMTMVMTMSAFAAAQLKEGDYSDQTRNLYELWSKIGFKNQACVASYKQKPTTDSIGVAAANKEITDANGKKVTIIAVAIRGSGYEAEWASNFTIGTDRKHQGFNEAATQVTDFLKKYVADNNIATRGQTVKVWMTGFSRAAATTNLACGMLDDNPDMLGVKVTNDNIYGFCFEPPMGGWAEDINGSAEKYSNIVNIINPCDMVPKVAPGIMGFERYGVDKYLPSKSTDANYAAYRDAMLEFYTNKENYSMDKYDNFFLIYDLPVQNVMLDTFMRVLGAEIAIDKQNFTTKYQTSLRQLLSSLMSSPTIKEAMKEVVIARGKMFEFLKLVYDIIFNGKKVSEIKEFMISVIYDIHIEAKIPISKEKAAELYNGLDELTNQLIFRETTTLVNFLKNVSIILEGHSGALCLAWLKSMDPNYVSNPVQHYTDGVYRTVEVVSGTWNNNFSVTIEQLNGSEKTLAASISENGKEWLKGDQYLACTNNYGGKRQIALPAFENYRITVKTDQNQDIPISLKVLEYSSLTGTVKEIKNIKFTINQTNAMRGKLPDKRILQGDESEYTFELESLMGDSIENLTVETLSGDQIQTAIVRVASDNVDMGKAYVGTTDIVGTYAGAVAEPEDGYIFIGWRDEAGNLVSKDLSYNFEIEKETNLIAYFAKAEEPTTESTTTVAPTQTSTNATIAPSNNSSSDGKGSGSVNTGDNNDFIFYIVLMLAGAGVMFAFVYKKRGNAHE